METVQSSTPMDAPRRRGKAAAAEPGPPAQLVTASIPLHQLAPSSTNPRKHFDQAKLDELAESMKVRGVLQPILVRPRGNGKADAYEIVAGERRYRAAKIAELPAMPAVIRDLDDVEVLECQTIENLQRDDLHPLEEAAGYQALMLRAGYKADRIAAKVGRSEKYVYDRMKLLQLVPKAQTLFLEGRFEAGHAILLARLKPEDQERAIEPPEDGYGGGRNAALFERDRGLPFDDEAYERSRKDPYVETKPVSVREFGSWVKRNVRMEPEHVDAFLFPQTAATLAAAADDKLRVILITRRHMASDEVRGAGKERVYGETAWKRADGKEKSKTCEWSRVGLVAADDGQGEAFRVCINREKCETHWGAEVKSRKARQRAAAAQASGDPKAIERASRADAKREAEHQARRAEAERWERARPAIWKAIAAAVKKAPTRAGGHLARVLIEQLATKWDREQFERDLGEKIEDFVPLGKTTEDLVRHAAFLALLWDAFNNDDSPESYIKRGRAFGLDIRKIVDQAAPPVQTSGKPGKPVRGTCRKCGCQENTPCASGCGWADKTETRCTACFPPTLKSRAKKGR